KSAAGGMVHARARSLHAELGIAVLAAGGSRRLGRPKQLVELGGEPLVHRIAETCVELRSGPVAVVLGAEATAIGTALGDLRVARIANPAWQTGIASSIRAAVDWARAAGVHALAIVLADQPRLAVHHLAALRDAWLAGAPIAASRFAGVVGAPAIFDRSTWDALAALTGDHGAGRLLRDRQDLVAIDWPDGALDVDTEADVAALER
ncbi:MAG TPA: nucleotidyltransferase family protein, partial [Kofleriaceae bacterium]